LSKIEPISSEEFLEIYNDIQGFPSLSDVAEALNLSYQTIKNKSTVIRNQIKRDPESKLSIITRMNWQKPDVPMSEHESKYKDWTPQQCIDELTRIQEGSPDREITRNFFRENSAISDAVWSQHFGTFDEFKRQAGVKLNRQQHQLERQIAKHASVDHYRVMNESRRNYGDTYTRDHPDRFKTIMLCSDLHDIEIDEFFLRVWLDTVARVEPTDVSFVGDIFDLPEFGKYGVDPREWDVVGRIKFAHDKILRPTREAAPDATIDLIEGNHEARMLRMLCDATPAMRAVLSDLHGFTIGKLLGLDEFEMNYHAKLDLAAFTNADLKKGLAANHKIYYESLLAHHFPHARHMGIPGVNGHHHAHNVWPQFNQTFGAYEWHQMGCGHKREASYCDGEKWHTGFAIAHIDTKTKSTVIEYVPVRDFAVVGGKWYYRDPKLEKSVAI
jgi:hypothetical protein